MPTEVLSAGLTHLLVEDRVYATPASRHFLQSTDVVETSIDGSTWTAVTASTTGIENVAPFVRCTNSTTCQVTVKKF